MKKIIALLSILYFSNIHSQEKNKDCKEIIRLTITKYSSDTIPVYHKFDNRLLLENIEAAYYKKFDSINKNNNERLFDVMFNDTVSIYIKNICFDYWQNTELAGHSKKVKKYYKKELTKNKADIMVSISVPIISCDKEYAIVYYSRLENGRPYCVGILVFSKNHDTWELTEDKVIYWIDY